ncbi:SHOCT domain-containing protein [Cognatishimia sp. D5M38]|uniref:SHOCT domain-containing protein n=1 Tax=Cognatishimia coralii TaxID=3083254 RepID=A0ABU8QI73_9RHOB
MTIQIQRHSFITSALLLLMFSALCGWGVYYGSVVDPELSWLAGLSGLLLLAFFFAPVGIAHDLSHYIPEIKELKETNNRYKKTKIRHPAFWWIILLMFGSFFSLGLTWFIALFLVTGTINVTIPDDIAVASGLKEATYGASQASNQSSNSEELIRWKKLLDEGVISDEEFEAKKTSLI